MCASLLLFQAGIAAGPPAPPPVPTKPPPPAVTPPATPGPSSEAAKHANSGSAAGPRYETAQAAAGAFIDATRRKDWRASLACFTPQSQDLALVHLITMAQFVASASEDGRGALGQLFTKHGFDAGSAQGAATEVITAAQKENRKPELRKVVKAYADTITEKEGLFVALLAWADRGDSARGPTKAAEVTLRDVEVSAETASATLSDGGREAWKIGLRRVDGAWFLDLPEPQFAPSGWNDVFLFGYLDAIHKWRF